MPKRNPAELAAKLINKYANAKEKLTTTTELTVQNTYRLVYINYFGSLTLSVTSSCSSSTTTNAPKDYAFPGHETEEYL